jgi:hypothetical protein
MKGQWTRLPQLAGGPSLGPPGAVPPSNPLSGLLYLGTDGGVDMPRFRVRSVAESPTTPVEFDLCERCAANGDIVRTVVHDKLGIAKADGDESPVDRVSHRSYDFQPRPTPCFSCARILSSEDD